MSRRECLARRTDEGHLFVCPFCRADARIAAAWKGLAVQERGGRGRAFVAAVLNDVRHETCAGRTASGWRLPPRALLLPSRAWLLRARASPPEPEESYATLALPTRWRTAAAMTAG
jgi:hypothetical protein